MVMQTEYDTIDTCVIQFRSIVESCDYGSLEESILCDRLVIGTHNLRSRDKLLRKRPVPNLNRCIVLKDSKIFQQHSFATPLVTNTDEEKPAHVHAFNHTPKLQHTK